MAAENPSSRFGLSVYILEPVDNRSEAGGGRVGFGRWGMILVVVVARTRVRIVEAAAELFSVNGYAGATLQAIADRAGVSVETVGLAGPKRVLLKAAFDASFASSADAFPASGSPVYITLAAVMSFPDAVREYARVMAAAIVRTSGLWVAFQAAADTDGRAAVLFAEVRERRRMEFTRTAQWLADQGIVDQRTVPLLVVEFFAVASHEVFLVLHAECGFGVREFTDRLTLQLFNLLDLPQETIDTQVTVGP